MLPAVSRLQRGSAARQGAEQRGGRGRVTGTGTGQGRMVSCMLKELERLRPLCVEEKVEEDSEEEEKKDEKKDEK
jgi:hypothetical protein